MLFVCLFVCLKKAFQDVSETEETGMKNRYTVETAALKQPCFNEMTVNLTREGTDISYLGNTV